MTEVQQSYNVYDLYPELSYNCISYLIQNNEIIWKLLKYSSADAWDQPNLTASEKRALIYAGQSNITDYRIFIDSGQDSSWTIEACIIRISPLELQPINYVVGNVTMGFEVYCHYKINTLSNYKTRIDMIIQSFIETFNGVEIGGLGKLYFDAKANPRCKAILVGSIPFKGKALVMCNWVL